MVSPKVSSKVIKIQHDLYACIESSLHIYERIVVNNSV